MLMTWANVRPWFKFWMQVNLTHHVSLSSHGLLCGKAVLEDVVDELLSNKGRLIVAVVDDEGSEEVCSRL
jgi:hypothetical protein